MNSSIPPAVLTSPEYKTLLSKCIHCGLCLQSCPTYSVFGTEMDSPRGRIALIRAASEGLVGLGGAFESHVALCLMCRSCEQACPSGVRYGTIIETARLAVERGRRKGVGERFIRWLALRQLIPNPNRLRLLARLYKLYQGLKLQDLVRRFSLLPKSLRSGEELMPSITTLSKVDRNIAPAIGEYRGKVAFFKGCIQDAFLNRVNEATVMVLQRNGFEVHFPLEQTCCGAAQLHVGEEDLFVELAKRNIDAFATNEYTAIINNAGGCGSTLKEYGILLKDDPHYAQKANQFSSMVRDISEFLVENLHAIPKGKITSRVTYSDSCHLRHVQKVSNPPRALLRQIPGLELVELNKPDRCCGSGGVYNLMQVETANAILDEKMADIASTGAEAIVVTNPGCQLQLLYGVRRARLNMRVVHLVELLEESYQAEEWGRQ